MRIFKIIYRSRGVLRPDRSQNETDIENIITESRMWNRAHSITGALLVSSYGYAQVLEGPPAEVKTLFGRISLDSRHCDVDLLYHDYHADRDFANWAMALASPSSQSDIELAATSYRFDVGIPNNGDEIRMMLRWLLIDEPAARRQTLQ